ncbi:MAG: pyridoxamine 5'-phosphate oxidase family protein [Clostridia bacterium]|nr:pyridoxamine 5'-phosphate oxidase family protein [Clostridia bacterium]
MGSSDELNALLGGKRYASAAELLLKSGTVFAATVGLDGRPQVRPAAFAFEQDGALYFAALKSSRMYAELSKTPWAQFCVLDAERGVSFRLSGKAVFTEDEAVTARAAEARPDVLAAAGGECKMLIAFFLTGASGLLESGAEEMKLVLPDPSGVFIGITIKKKPELRDRIARVIERREAEPPVKTADAARLYDGALFVFADAAKKLWPRMDVTPLERTAVFETYDEREKYTAAAAALIGNAEIDSPEDITYWLDPERWTDSEFLA